MAHDSSPPQPEPGDPGASAWALVRTLAREAAAIAVTGEAAAFMLTDAGALSRVPAGDRRQAVSWRPGHGWVLPAVAGGAVDEGRALVDLYLPVCSATAAAPITLGHMGQSLDGFIATRSGDSRYVNGDENMRHMHRLRALCDAVVVGAGTVAADDPQLTTRHVPGPNPLRVVIDPMARLASGYQLFQDGAAPTLYVYVKRYVSGAAPTAGQAEVLGVG